MATTYRSTKLLSFSVRRKAEKVEKTETVNKTVDKWYIPIEEAVRLLRSTGLTGALLQYKDWTGDIVLSAYNSISSAFSAKERRGLFGARVYSLDLTSMSLVREME